MTPEIPKIIVITGAESTGKSMLTRQVSRHFMAPSFSEYAREYIQDLDRKYTFYDVEHIARMQQAQMEKAINLKSEVVFFDTWLIITRIWFEVAFHHVPPWIDGAIKNAPVSLFLLCDTDIPWVPDPLRENGGKMREILSEKYRRMIEFYGYNYGLVKGNGDMRIMNAMEYILKIL